MNMYWSGVINQIKQRVQSIDIDHKVLQRLESASERLGELTKSETVAAEEAFSAFDTDSTGKVHMDHVCAMFRMLGQNPTKKEINFMLYELEWMSAGAAKESSHYINFTGFLRLLLFNAKTKEQMESEYMECFKLFDPDGEGYVCLDEIRKMIRASETDLSPDQIYELFKSMDLWKNGKIRYKELVKHLVKDNVFMERKL